MTMWVCDEDMRDYARVAWFKGCESCNILSIFASLIALIWSPNLFPESASFSVSKYVLSDSKIGFAVMLAASSLLLP